MKERKQEYNFTPMDRTFFLPRTAGLAKALLGKLLVRRLRRQILAGRIVEVEAYLSHGDKAAHSFRGKTKRTRVLYGEPGRAYIFQLRNCYCFNVVAEPPDSPGCVLIRAIEPIEGITKMKKLRGIDGSNTTKIANGPGKVCQALDINLSLYGVDVTNQKSPLQICEDINSGRLEIAMTKRIGITKDANRKLRFMIRDNQYALRP